MGYLEDIEDDRERVVLGGRLSLVSKQLLPLGQRVTWSRTVILCSDRNLLFTDVLKGRPDLLAHLRYLTFARPIGQSVSPRWVGRMVEVADGCTSALKVVDCASAWSADKGNQNVAFKSQKLLSNLARSPMAATLQSLGIRVVLGTDIAVADLGATINKFREVKSLLIRSTWAVPLPAGQMGLSGSLGVTELIVDDAGLVGQRSLFHLLSPCLVPSQIKHLHVHIGQASFGGPGQLSRFTNLVGVHFNASRGSNFGAALPQWVAGLSHLPHLEYVSLGSKSLLADPHSGLDISTVPLDVLLSSLPPLVKTYKVDGVYFINSLGLDFFSHREHVLGDRKRFNMTTQVYVRLDDPDFGRRRFALCRLNKPDGTSLWGIHRLVRATLSPASCPCLLTS